MTRFATFTNDAAARDLTAVLGNRRATRAAMQADFAILADGAEILVRNSALGEKRWVKTTADISALVTLDVDGVYALPESGENGSTGGFLADLREVDLADPDLGIDFDAVGTNAAKINRLVDIADAAGASSVVRWKVVCSKTNACIRHDATLLFDQGRVIFDGPGSQVFEFLYTAATGDAIQVGGSAGGFAKENFVAFRGATIRAQNAAHQNGAGLLLKDADRVRVEDAPQLGFATSVAKDNCDHIRLTNSPGSFGSRTHLALYAVEDRGNANADSRGYNTSQYRLFHDYFPDDLFGSCCLRAYHYAQQFDGNWVLGEHTFGAAVGLLINGLKGTAGDRHAVSYNAAGTYYDRAGVANILIRGANVKSVNITGFEAREAGFRPILDRDLSSPPGSPSEGDAYIVGASPSGGWSGFSEHDVAIYDGAAWQAKTPIDGTLLWVKDEDVVVEFNGTSYATVTWATGGVGIQVRPDAGETIRGLNLHGKVWQSVKSAAVFDEGSGVISQLAYDLQVYDCNSDAAAGVADIYVNVTDGYGTSKHGGNIATGHCVEIPATCGDNFVLGPVGLGDSATTAAIDDARNAADVRAAFVSIMEGERLTATDRLVIKDALQIFGQTIQRANDTGQIAIRAGNGSSNGAQITGFGKDHSTNPGKIIEQFGFLGGDSEWKLQHHDGTTLRDAMVTAYDHSEAALIHRFYGFLRAVQSASALTPATGLLTLNAPFSRVLGEGGAADNVVRLSGAAEDGALGILMGGAVGQPITFKHQTNEGANTGNIKTYTAGDLTIAGNQQWVWWFYYNGTYHLKA